MKILTNRRFEEEVNKRIANERERDHIWDKLQTLENTVSELSFKVRCLEERPDKVEVRSE